MITERYECNALIEKLNRLLQCRIDVHVFCSSGCYRSITFRYIQIFAGPFVGAGWTMINQTILETMIIRIDLIFLLCHNPDLIVPYHVVTFRFTLNAIKIWSASNTRWNFFFPDSTHIERIVYLVHLRSLNLGKNQLA